MAETLSRQSLRRWGKSIGIRLPAAVARAAHLQENQEVELTVEVPKAQTLTIVTVKVED